MATVYSGGGASLARWWRDRDGVPATNRHADSVEVDTVDFSTRLSPGETITSASVDDGGVEATATAWSLDVDLDVVGSGGELVLTVVTSSGRTLVQRLRYYDSTHALGGDYPT